MSRGDATRERPVSNYVGTAIGIALTGGIGLIVAISSYGAYSNVMNEMQKEVHHHLAAARHAADLIVNLNALGQHLTVAPAEHTWNRYRSVAAAFAAVRQGVEGLGAEPHPDPVAEAIHAAVERRFDRLASALSQHPSSQGGGTNAAELGLALRSMSLAVEQSQGLHVRSLARMNVESRSLVVNAYRTFALSGLSVLVLAVIIGLSVLYRLRAAIRREAVTRDALRRAQTQHQQSLKMQALGQLAAGVAHDFNNLLTVVLSSSEVLEEALEEESPLRVETANILRASEQAAALTRQMLSLGRGDPRLTQSEVVDLNAVTGPMEILLRRLLGPESTLVLDLEPRLAKVETDPREIERILVNLVSNASDAMPAGGTVTVETANCSPRAEAEGQEKSREQVRLSVRDTGSGMDEETRERAFDPFFTTKDVGEGTGLGLAMVHSAVGRCGGSVSVESESGVGTRVDIYFPRSDGEADGSGELPVPAATEASTILVVEDEQAVLDVAARVLREAGYRVIESQDGFDALERCAGHPERIDLILTDVMMPGMTGPDMVDRAKPLQPEARILFMSGYDGAQLPPGTQLLPKPFRRADLLNRVRETLGRLEGEGP